MWNLKEGLTEEENKANTERLKREVEALPQFIDGIISIKVHINTLPPKSNRSIALDSLFESEEALAAYVVHPEHQRVVEFGATILQDRACADFYE